MNIMEQLGVFAGDYKNAIRIKLQKNTPTIFTQVVNFETIEVFIHYSNVMDNWIVDFYKVKQSTYEPIVTGLLLEPLLNLLVGREYLGLGEFYLIPLNAETETEPSFNNLAQSFAIVWRF